MGVFALILLLPLVGKLGALFQGESTTETCRLSLAAVNSMGDAAKTVFSPKCFMTSKTLPEDSKKNDKKEIQKEIAEMISKCWYSHLEGTITKDTLKRSLWEDNCDVCYKFTITDLKQKYDDDGKKLEDEKDIDKIEIIDQIIYLMKELKDVKAESDDCYAGAGKCVTDYQYEKFKDDFLEGVPDEYEYVEHKKSPECGENLKCMQSRYSCYNKGGVCKDKPDGQTKCDPDYRAYDNWACPKSEGCCVKKENYYSYFDYVTRAKGAGKIVIDGKIEAFKEDKEVYAIAFVANTDSKARYFAPVGAGAVILGGGFLAIAGAPISLSVAGIAVAGAKFTTVAAVSGVTALGVSSATEAAVDSVSKIMGTDPNYIYITKYEDLVNHCNVKNRG